MAAPFGCQLNYGQLLRNLRACGFSVLKLAHVNDIPDTDGSACGDLYEISRLEGAAEWFAHLEVYSDRLPVLPDVLRSIAVQLNVPEDKIINPKVN